MREGRLVRVSAVGVWDAVSPSRSNGGVDFEVDEEREGDTPYDHEGDEVTTVVALASARLVPLPADEAAVSDVWVWRSEILLDVVREMGKCLHRIVRIRGPKMRGTWSHLAQ